MAKKPKPKPPVHDERCGNCYYNEEKLCDRNPEKCPYNQEPKEEGDEDE